MHKKLASELNSLAHDILTMRDRNDVFLLKEKASKIYEKLSLLVYVEEYLNTTPQATETKEELISKIEKAEELKENTTTKPILEISTKEGSPNEVFLSVEPKNTTKSIEVTTNEVFLSVEPKNTIKSIEVIDQEEVLPKKIIPAIQKNVVNKSTQEVTEELNIEESIKLIKEQPTLKHKTDSPTLEDELEDTLSVDVMTELFTKIAPQQSLNDKLSSNTTTIQIGLNDRIAFVNHLFKGDQTTFNHVIRKLNLMKTEQEAYDFIKYSVKPEYDWSEKEEYETRLYENINRKFN